jgi:hypothetical protein
MANIIDNKKLIDIIDRRLFRVSPEVLKLFPPILSGQIKGIFSICTENYFILCIIDPEDMKRIDELTKLNYHPFPGLISEPPNIGGAFHLKNSRNNIFQSCTVVNSPSFILEEDNTLVLINHNQSINSVEKGPYEYNIKLAYIISFGNEITFQNIYEIIDELIAYSVKHWTETRDV